MGKRPTPEQVRWQEAARARLQLVLDRYAVAISQPEESQENELLEFAKIGGHLTYLIDSVVVIDGAGAEKVPREGGRGAWPGPPRAQVGGTRTCWAGTSGRCPAVSVEFVVRAFPLTLLASTLGLRYPARRPYLVVLITVRIFPKTNKEARELHAVR